MSERSGWAQYALSGMVGTVHGVRWSGMGGAWRVVVRLEMVPFRKPLPGGTTHKERPSLFSFEPRWVRLVGDGQARAPELGRVYLDGMRQREVEVVALAEDRAIGAVVVLRSDDGTETLGMNQWMRAQSSHSPRFTIANA